MTRALLAHYERHEAGSGKVPPAPDVTGVWYTLTQRFELLPGEPRLPPPPVTGKAKGARPTLAVLPRRAGATAGS